MEHSGAFESIQTKFSEIRDRVTAVVKGEAAGLYLYGRPGTAKTYLIRTNLEEQSVRYAYANGHLTPAGLFDLIKENPRAVIVLDDVSALFRQQQALQILLAACGMPHDGGRTRMVRYKTRHGDDVVGFKGSIVAISNLSLLQHNREVLNALNDRVQVLEYDPTDEEIEAVIFDIAKTGPRGITPAEAASAAEVLLRECRTAGVRPSIRLFVDKAIPDFRLWRSGDSECDWRDLIRSSVRQSTVRPQHAIRETSRTKRIASEKQIAREICIDLADPCQRVEAWQKRTGKCQASFYRRCGELRKEGLLTG